jgi:hypothetical protein
VRELSISRIKAILSLLGYTQQMYCYRHCSAERINAVGDEKLINENDIPKTKE